MASQQGPHASGGTEMPPRRIPPSPLPSEPYWQALPGSRALLHAIAEEPWDDTLRLILADWLEDHGESCERSV
jgi:uncharacterized protein (TIGR02996 family)